MGFFELIGHFFLRKNRLYLFFLCFFTPFALTGSFLFSRFLSLRDMENAFDAAALRARSALEKREQKFQFLQRYASSDLYFINQHLESLPLLQKETEILQKILQHPAASHCDELAKRLAYLQGADNRLTFAEEMIRTSSRIKETEAKLLHPAEIDAHDLDRLLSLIENISITSYRPFSNSPQLLIQDFHLSKKDPFLYKLDLTLLKREFMSHNENKN